MAFTNYNAPKFLSNADLLARAPSVFQTERYEGVSGGYKVIPTIDVIEGLRQQGFFPIAASESRTRLEAKRGFVKHMLRFQQENAFEKVGDHALQMVMSNAHDGTGSYILNAGVLRLACLNGMVVPESEIDRVRVSHRGDVINNVIEGTFRVINEAPLALEHMEAMKGIELLQSERLAFAKAAAALRWDPKEFEVKVEDIAAPTRHVDAKADLWTTFNVVQEKIIRGGVVAKNIETGHYQKSREIKAVNENIKMNKALWTLAEEMAKIKVA